MSGPRSSRRRSGGPLEPSPGIPLLLVLGALVLGVRLGGPHRDAERVGLARRRRVVAHVRSVLQLGAVRLALVADGLQAGLAARAGVEGVARLDLEAVALEVGVHAVALAAVDH